MKLHSLLPSQALDLAYRRQKAHRATLDTFEQARRQLLPELDAAQDEADMVLPLTKFLNAVGFAGYYINSHKKRDLVMRTGPQATDPFGVLFELKHQKNKAEMVQPGNLNRKALHELLLYYFQERTSEQQLPELRQLVITSGYEWFIFDAHEFHRVFWKYPELRQQFQKFKQGQTTAGDTSHFYQDIARPLLDKLETEVKFTYFTLDPRDEKGQRKELGERGRVWLSKVFSAPHLLKEPFAQDANTLNRAFYEELLYLMGLEEIKDKGRKLIQRCAPERQQRGSLLENTLVQLRAEDMLRNLPADELSTYGDTPEAQAEGVALALCLTWVSRLLFLKLLEGQLRRYHQPGPDQPFRFLDPQQLKEYDLLNRLFYRILNRPTPEREQPEAGLYPHVPYLNSSLFEPSALERVTLRISGLDDMIPLPLLGSKGKGKGSRSVLRQDAAGLHPTALTYLLRFLDAYDFASEGSEAVQDDERPLISAAVLGLIFEKINGYRDGSFYTPGFITMYMCRHTLRRAVVRHFNERYGWQADDVSSLAEQIADETKRRPEFSQAFNELRVLDPAVGSGHFLVSALNELLAIKSELGLLLDDEGKRLRYRLTVARDELAVTSDEDDTLFEYRATWDETAQTRRVGREHTRLQSALFREKRHLIEHCLYGVDLNPNSVRICRLRLWIELLKHAYYTPESQFRELETLPNLELNVRAGNSLISRYPLGADLTEVFRKKDFSLAAYRRAVGEFFSARGREQKQVLEDFLQRLKDQFRTDIQRHDPLLKRITRAKEDLLRAELDQKPDLFGKARLSADDAWAKQTTARLNLEKLEQERQQREQGTLFRDAFEWRFEFPEVLNPDGSFRGFDAVLGNPPYVAQIQDKQIKEALKKTFVTSQYQLDLYVAFIEMSVRLLKGGGMISFITPNSWLKNMMFSEARKFILNNLSINELVPNLPNVFTEANVDSAIFIAEKNATIEPLQVIRFEKGQFNQGHVVDTTRFLSNERYVFDVESDSDTSVVLNSMRKVAVQLQDLCDITRGVNSYDKARGQTDEIIKNRGYHADFRKDSTYVPELKGKHIRPFSYKWDGTSYISYGTWLAAPREPKFFTGSRLIMRQVLGDTLFCTIIKEDMVIDQSVFIAKLNTNTNNKYSLEYILGVLASPTLAYYFKRAANEFDDLFPKIKIGEFRELPIPTATAEQQAPIVALVEQVLAAKAADATADTQPLEQQIDALVAALYGLTPAETALLTA
ncbi:Eco57I restriction-modification methylase domain-containing protein [Hymenobacter sp. DG01]|uniref:type IIG restriction enzyme/methyltransferase n=1 Tax=Hymenobacter sp. DG01 TaxID=2584940 RepID=UPI00111DB563|nr:TaqI-like C-terminal specificity domain-containing protein [Hymenobacter sp. DG01]